jgi:hypothetical protein
MGVETSNKKTKPSDQSNIVVAIGKRKEDCGRLALSLQDVFSDSANLAGMQQKTSCPFDTEQEEEAQLEGKRRKKTIK